MATITQHAPGTFCWPELATTDQAGARTFYTALFGWKANESDMGNSETYTMLQNKDRSVGALYTMRKEQRAQGVPPNWTSYVAVTSADDAAKKAVELGQDPQGAIFAVWQAKKHNGAQVLDEPGSLSWTELTTSDTAGAQKFYTGLFGWGSESMPMGPMTYTLFKRGDKSAGGMMALTPEMGPVPPNWLPYFGVVDADATVAKAILAGGKVLVPPTNIPGGGRFAVLHDPQGATFGIHAQTA